ncbi:phosphotransferase [Priestia koreensis]|nr:phosphotransferase [Priestia koreensis]
MERLKQIENIIGEVINIELLNEQGWTSKVSRVQTETHTYLLKSAFTKRYRSWLVREAYVLETLQSTLLPVPTYYGFFEDEEGSHLIMSFEEGMTLRKAFSLAKTEQEKCKLMNSFGELIRKLHELPLNEPLRKSVPWLDGQLKQAEINLHEGGTDGNDVLLEKLHAEKPAPILETMIHGDCTMENVLVRDGKVETFIDVADLTIGDPRYDVALAVRRFTDHPQYIDAFYDGYQRLTISKEEYAYFDQGLYEFF